MKEKREEWGLSEDQDDWCKPQDLPTLWNLVSYHVARIYWLHGEGRAVDRSDSNDSGYYADAAYADVLVTNDKRFSAKSALIRRDELTIASFQDWANSIVSAH